LEWLRDNADVLRNQRSEPLAERAREIWATLRQENNVGLEAIRLTGENTTRRVELDADVGGVKAGVFGVMSQGELHALALALFPHGRQRRKARSGSSCWMIPFRRWTPRRSRDSLK
jgi:hypothetical protein